MSFIIYDGAQSLRVLYVSSRTSILLFYFLAITLGDHWNFLNCYESKLTPDIMHEDAGKVTNLSVPAFYYDIIIFKTRFGAVLL